MNWLTHHSKSEQYASQAEVAWRQNNLAKAQELYRFAAEEELLALAYLTSHKKRTLGITVVSAASLWFKANELRQAQQVAYQWLATDLLPPFATEQLKFILQTIWAKEMESKNQTVSQVAVFA